MKSRGTGKVYLVGAGPGDPGLLTLKGKECVEKADVIIYDYLANEEMLSYARPDATLIFMGKHGGGPIIPQEEINRIMVSLAREGKTIVRLKGGDPFIFGRGGEEAMVLADEGIPFEIVPGVTAGISAPAYAGIPLTYRNHSSTIAFITGHEDPSKVKSSIAWDKIATGVDTIVIFMGITTLSSIVSKLIENGRLPDTPVAVIQWGTKNTQKTVTGTLKNIVRKIRAQGIRPPGVVVVGKVVNLRRKLMWFEKLKSSGITIQYTSFKADALGMHILIAGTSKGICRVGFGDQSEFLRELRSAYKNPSIIGNERYFGTVLSELRNYFNGVPTDFTCSLDLSGTVFQQRVWKALLKIPYGKTVSYKDVALMIGQPKASRAVGTACRKNPVPIIVPCHRIINSNGGLGGYSSGIEIKKALLRLEGIRIVNDEG